MMHRINQGKASWMRGTRWLLFAVLMAVAVAGIGKVTVEAASEYPWEGRHVNMGLPAGDNIAWFQHQIYKKLMEELGYKVTIHPPVSIPVFFVSAAQGQLDFWANGWYPLYNDYINGPRVKGKVESVGYIVRAGALQGYLIDKKTADEYGITNLGQLKDPEIAKLFDIDGDGKADLIGCNPGWGCEVVIDHHLPAYGLTDTVTHVKGQYFALMAQTVRRFRRGQPILYYTWTPNWTVGVLEPGKDVVWLNVPFSSLPEGQKEQEAYTIVEDDIGCATTPCNIGWPANDIRVDANSAWLEKNPAARALFEAASIPMADMSVAAMAINDGATEAEIEAMAEEWIENHRDQVDQWLAAARQAGLEAEQR